MNNTGIFQDFIKNQFIIHIPHSSVNIPFTTGFNTKILQQEIDKLTDWKTDEIFKVDGITTIKAEFNRVFCDVERFEDSKELMAQKGRGFFYTLSDLGETLRTNKGNIKEKIYKEFYIPYHKKFTEITKNKLNHFKTVYILDAHSFSDIPFNTDIDKTMPRPDICIGTDKFHTPSFLTNYIYNIFKKEGYTIKINSPYSGTIIPKEFYGNENVKSIMIEINRKLYLDSNNKVIENNVKKINEIINKIFNF